MKLQIVNIEPAFQAKKEKPVGELVNVHFVTTLTIKEFIHLKESTELWGIDVVI